MCEMRCGGNKSIQSSFILTQANHPTMSLQHLDLLLERLISEKLSEGNLRFRHNKVAGLEGIPCGRIILFQSIHLSQMNWLEACIIQVIVCKEILDIIFQCSQITFPITSVCYTNVTFVLNLITEHSNHQNECTKRFLMRQNPQNVVLHDRCLLKSIIISSLAFRDTKN